jgi:type VI secretion system secreted protein VgrG
MPAPSPKSGQAPEPVAPAKPAEPKEAAKAGPGSNVSYQGGQEKPGGSHDKLQAPPYKPPETDEEKKKKCSWIEIELIGEDGKPYPGEAYQIKCPDGSLASGTLDEKGFARLEGIEPGSCDITFPGLDKEAWEPA